MNRYEGSTPVFNKDYFLKTIDEHKEIQYQKIIQQLYLGNIKGGVKCMREAIRIFHEVNNFYNFRYNNNQPKRFIALISVNREATESNQAIANLERCITYLDSSKAILPFVIDVLNNHNLLPNIDSETPYVHWVKNKAHKRFIKCIHCLEKGDIATGIQCAKETILLFQEVNELHRATEKLYIHSDAILSNEKHIQTINKCLELLQEPDHYLLIVIDVFRGRTKLPIALL